jgi:polyhydroxyalkanoate synthesis regulator phasin
VQKEVNTMTAKKAEKGRKGLPHRIAELQRTVEKQVRKRLDQATDLLPAAPRKAMKRLTADVDRARHDLRKRGDKLVADARKRAERLGADLQKRIEDVVTPLTHRLDVASRADVDRLRKRLHELERRIESHGQHPSTTA